MSMSDSSIRTDKKHRVFPGKFQALLSVHLTVVLKAEADLLSSSVFRKLLIVENKEGVNGRERRLDLIDFVPHEHFHEVDASRVGLQLVQPGLQLHKRVAFGDIVHCRHKRRERRSL